MADPEIWKALIETGNPYVQQERQQKGLMGMMLLQEKQREMEDTQRLRDLYSSGQPVNPNQVMAINPKLGIEMQQAGNQAFMQQLQAEDMMRKKDEYESKVYAQHTAPVAQAYHDAVKAGTDPKVAESQFRWAIGDAQKNIHERFGITPKADFTKFSPQEIATRAHMLGVDVPWIKEIQEEEQSRRAVQQKQMPSFSDRYYTGPDGLIHPNPYFQQGGGGQQPEMQSKIQPYPVFEFDGKTYQGPEFMRMAIREKDSAKKQRMEAIMDAGFQQQQEGTLTSFDVVEKPKTRQQLAIEEETGKERAKLNVQDEQDAENKLSTIASMPSDEELLKYLNDSTLGKGEEILKGPVASFFHVENEAQAADTVLGALQQNIKNIATKAKGDMNKTEVEEFNAAVGALNNKDIGPQARFKAYTVAKNMAIKKIALKHPAIAAKYGMGTATQAGEQPQTPTAKTEEEAHKLATTLPAGSEFIGPDGKTYKVRGR